MSFIQRRVVWTKQPPPKTAMALTSLTEGVVAILSGKEIIIPRGHGGTESANNASERVGTKSGMASRWTAAAGENATLCDGSKIGTSGFGIFVIRQVTDTTDRDSSLFGVGNVNSPNEAFRCGGHVPFSDGVVYLDYGGSSGNNRISWAGYSKSVTLEDRWFFTGGSRGLEIYLNGTLEASNATSVSRSSRTSDPFFINAGNSGPTPPVGDAQDVVLAVVWNRQPNVREIAAMFADEHQIWRPRTQYIQIPAVAGDILMGQVMM